MYSNWNDDLCLCPSLTSFQENFEACSMTWQLCTKGCAYSRAILGPAFCQYCVSTCQKSFDACRSEAVKTTNFS